MDGGSGDRSVWRERDVRLAVPARAISTAGDSMALVALMLRAHGSGYGTFAVAGLMVCFALPAIVLMGHAGRIVDATDSRTVLRYANVAQVVACLGLASTTNLWATYACVLALQTGQAFSGPTWMALIPRIVGRDRVGKVMSWQQGLNASLGPAGAALGGILVGYLGDRVAFLADALTFLVLLAAGQLLRTRRGGEQRPVEELPAPLTRRELRQREAMSRATISQGLRILRRSDVVTWTLFAATMPIILVMESANVNEVFLVCDHLHASAQMYGLTEIFTQIGAVAGAMVAGRVLLDRTRAYGNLLGMGASAIIVILVGLSPSYWVYAALVAVMGITGTGGNSLYFALLATRTPEEHRGKIMSGVSGVARFVSLLALALGAVVGRLVGAREVFWMAGALGLVAVLSAAAVFVRAERAGGVWGHDKAPHGLEPEGAVAG